MHCCSPSRQNKVFITVQFWVIVHTVHSVPNRRVGQNKRAGGKFLKKHFNKAMQGGFFLTINKSAGQIPIKMQENNRAGGFFSQKQYTCLPK